MSGGPRGERPSKQFLNFLTKFKKQRTHALTHATMGNTKYEHAVVTAHQINGEQVTTDTPLDFIEENIEAPSTSIARANDFNNIFLTTVDDFFFQISMAHKPPRTGFLFFFRPFPSLKTTALF